MCLADIQPHLLIMAEAASMLQGWSREVATETASLGSLKHLYPVLYRGHLPTWVDLINAQSLKMTLKSKSEAPTIPLPQAFLDLGFHSAELTGRSHHFLGGGRQGIKKLDSWM